MPIGEAWNVDDPKKPWIDWDPEANIRIPIGVADWLAELGDTYLSHDVITAAPLECADEGTHADGTIPVRMRLVASPSFTPGLKYPFTLRIFGADGQTQDDRTFYLKVKDR